MHSHKISLFNKFIAISTLVVSFSAASIVSFASGVAGVCNGSNVNYRTAADVNSNKIGQLQAGDKVSVIDYENDWYKINVNNDTAFVKKDLIQVISNAYANDNEINVRSTSSTSGQIIGQLNLGDNINVIAQSGEWYKIKFNGNDAWVYSEYIKVVNRNFSGEGVLGVSMTKTNSTGVINGDSVNLRDEANTNSNIITQLSLNTTVTILGTYGDWYYINYNNFTGYISSKFVTVTENKTSNNSSMSAVAALQKFVYVISEQGINLREYPAVNADRKKVLVFGQKLKVVKEVNSEWLQVQTTDGDDGYVYNQYVDDTVSNNSGKGKVIITDNEAVEVTETAVDNTSEDSSIRDNVVAYAKKFQGTPYVWAGNSLTNGVDCSGLTQQVMKHFGINIPRTSREQATVGTYVKKADLLPGDLVFFDSYHEGYITHVGMFVGNGNFIQASSSKKYNKVVVSPLSDYNNVYVTARRVIK